MSLMMDVLLTTGAKHRVCREQRIDSLNECASVRARAFAQQRAPRAAVVRYIPSAAV